MTQRGHIRLVLKSPFLQTGLLIRESPSSCPYPLGFQGCFAFSAFESYRFGGWEDDSHFEVWVLGQATGEDCVPPKVDVVATRAEKFCHSVGDIARRRLGSEMGLFDEQDGVLAVFAGIAGFVIHDGGGKGAKDVDCLEHGILIENAGESEVGQGVHLVGIEGKQE